MWQYTLIDYTSGYPVSTVIDEPVGWDGLPIKLLRDGNWHGFFEFFDESITGLRYYGAALAILKNAYEVAGIEAAVNLKIEYSCSETDPLQELYTGRFNFNFYRNVVSGTSDGCYVECNVTTTTAIVTLKNRYDQAVDLDSLKAFDGSTLASYTDLGKTIELPSKNIILESKFNQAEQDEFCEFIDNAAPFAELIQPEMFAELQDLEITNNLILQHSYTTSPTSFGPNPPQPIYDSTLSNYVFPITFNISWDFEGGFTDRSSIPASPSDYCANAPFDIFRQVLEEGGTGGPRDIYLRMFIGSTITNWRTDPHTDLVTLTIPSTFLTSPVGPFAFSGTGTTSVTINAGDKIWLFWVLPYQSNLSTSSSIALQWTFDYTKKYFDFNADTLYPATNGKVYLINESLSRAAEAITNDELRVYSDYFGRTDAQPYTSSSDGCGSLECITLGRKIRRALLVDGTQPPMSVSMRELFEAMNSIHNIGMGLEDDPNRAGYQMLRIEPEEYFYNSSVLLTFDSVNVVEYSVDTSQNIANVNIGYADWQCWESNGLDEFNTGRTYRTPLTTANKTVDLKCTFIGAGYAIEFTRRQGPTSTDWRFDSDKFVICLRRNVGDLEVELGAVDVGSAENVLDPATLYNARISPARNAIRHLSSIFRAVADYANATLYFTSGEANILAKMEMTSTTCRVENAPLQENQDIDYSITTTPNYPLFRNALVKFTYPLSVSQFRTIKANPYGLIEWSDATGTTYQGWINELNYIPEQGEGTFTLRPKIT